MHGFSLPPTSSSPPPSRHPNLKVTFVKKGTFGTERRRNGSQVDAWEAGPGTATFILQNSCGAFQQNFGDQIALIQGSQPLLCALVEALRLKSNKRHHAAGTRGEAPLCVLWASSGTGAKSEVLARVWGVTRGWEACAPRARPCRVPLAALWRPGPAQ